MRKAFLVVGLFLALSLTVLGQAFELEGEWVSVNDRTRGITRIRISQDGAGLVIEAWGKCHPTDCVWGGVRLLPVGDHVEDFRSARGFAIWDPGFATKYVNLVSHRNRLIVEVTTVFKDCSQRANFRMVETLRREGEAEL